VNQKPPSQIVGSNSILRKFQFAEPKPPAPPALVLSVAEGSRRLLALSPTSDSVGKRPDRRQHPDASDCLNSQPVRLQVESVYTIKLRHSLMLAAWLCIALGPVAQMNAQTTNAPRPASPTPSAQSSTPSPAKPGQLEDKVEKYLRNMYAWGPQYEIKLGPTKPSPIPDLLEIPVTVGLNGQSDTAIVYVSKDGKFIFRGELSDMTVDPLAEARSKLNPGTSPSLGPTDAKITLIEFADFECPSCRQLDRALRELLPQHPEIRFVYKDFPLTTIHPWAMTASLAGQCTAQQNPASFWKIHDIIFDSQDLITPSNVWEKMADFATQIGLNVETFRACMANPDTTHEIEKTTAEGQDLNVTGTPTIFVNGRRIIGPDEALLKQFIDFESTRAR
jgi:protein-disulfide isomerase